MADRLAMTCKGFARLVREVGIPKIRLGHRTVRYAPEAVMALATGPAPLAAAPHPPR